MDNYTSNSFMIQPAHLSRSFATLNCERLLLRSPFGWAFKLCKCLLILRPTREKACVWLGDFL